MSSFYPENSREYLVAELKARILRRPLYSQRAFARDLGLSASSLADFLNGKMSLSVGRIQQISRGLGLTIDQTQHWCDLLKSESLKRPKEKELALVRVQARLQAQEQTIHAEQFKMISEWYHLAFLEMIKIDSKRYSDLSYSAEQLGITTGQMRKAVQRLLRFEILTLDQGVYSAQKEIRFDSPVPSKTIRGFHKQILKKAADSVEGQNLEERFLSSTIFSIPKSQRADFMTRLKSLALESIGKHQKEHKNEPRDAVYCLSLQCFNLLPGEKLKNKKLKPSSAGKS